MIGIGAKWSSWHIAGLLLLFLLLVSLILRWQWQFAGLYGQDAHEYLRYTKSIAGWLGGDEHPGEFFWPLSFPVFGAILSYVSPFSTADSLQIISLLAHLFTSLILIHLLSERQSKVGVFWVVLAYFLSPQALRSGFLVMSDALSVLGVVGCYYFYFKSQKDVSLLNLLGLFCSAGLAVSTRYVVFLLVVGPVLHQFILSLKKGRWLYLLISIVVALLFFVPHLILRWEDPLDFLQHQFMGNWSFSNSWKNQFASPTGQFYYRFPNLIYSFFYWFHPAFLLLGIVFIPFIKHWWPKNLPHKLLLFSVLGYSIFLAGIPFQNQRFLLPALPLVIILFYPAVEQLVEYRTRLVRWLIPITLFGFGLLQLGVFAYMLKPLIDLNQIEQQLAERLQHYPAHQLYTFYYDLALQTYEVPQPITNIWKAEEISCQKDDLVLFHPTQFSQQWQGHRLLQNWT
ncbi:MAG: glycosyltransferase family 39 protein, partial [Bacteroidota bacterium]